MINEVKKGMKARPKGTFMNLKEIESVLMLQVHLCHTEHVLYLPVLVFGVVDAGRHPSCRI